MHRVRSLSIALLLAVSSAVPCFGQSLAPANAQPRVHYDRQCFTIDGKDTFIYSAAFHYFRCPKPLWKARFQKLKEAGFNTVETYVAWNWHERTLPASLDDFSKIDLTDYTDWLTMAHEMGFYTIVRPGPYICAEWDGGGYPQWLTLHRPATYDGMWYRSDDPTYLAWCKHWFTAVAKATKPFLLTSKAPGDKGTILWQIENEYAFAGRPVEMMRGQLLFLGKASKELGIDVPLFMCVNKREELAKDEWLAANTFDTDNLYPGFNLGGIANQVSYFTRTQPEKPKMITELQGGWFSNVGGRLSEDQGHNAAQIQQLTLLMWELGYTSTNYYMAFGGTNFGDWAAANITTTYDYNAPLRETGGVTDRYAAVKGMGAFVATYGDRLTRTEREENVITDKTHTDVSVVSRKANDGTRFVFVRNESRDQPREGTFTLSLGNGEPVRATYHLGAFGSAIYVIEPGSREGTWHPTPAAAPQRPTDLPAEITITTADRRDESVADLSFQPYARGKSVEDFGIFDRRTTFYRASVNVDAIASTPILHIALHDRDDVSVFANGQRLTGPSHGDGSVEFKLDHVTRGQPVDLQLVYENGGRPNGGTGMERRNGLSEVSLSAFSSLGHEVHGWKSTPLGDADAKTLVGVEVDDAKWPRARLRDDGQPAGTTAVYRAAFEMTDAELAQPHEITIGRIDDSGQVYLNGELVGTSTNWNQAFVADITRQLKPGRNVVAVVVKNDQGDGGLSRGISVRPSAKDEHAIRDIDWQIATDSVGAKHNWSGDESAEGWQSTPIGTAADKSTDTAAPLTWFRLNFDLPKTSEHAFIPWRARLELSGNAFLYLNGQPLGRAWNAGPQRDFYLPDCWLNPNGHNTLTICARGIDGPPTIKKASVLPYAEQAEKR